MFICHPHAARLGARPEKIWTATAPNPAASAFDIMAAFSQGSVVSESDITATPFKVHQLQFMLATSHGVPARVSVSKPMAVGLNFGSAFQYRIDLVVLSCPLGSSSGPETLIRNLILMLSEADLVKASCRGHLMRGASACRTSKLVRDEDSISQY